MEITIDSPDYIEDYDYFQYKKNIRILKLNEKDKEYQLYLKQIKKQQLAKSLSDGIDTFHKLELTIDRLKNILIPHDIRNLNIQTLVNHINIVLMKQTNNYHHYHYISSKILYQIQYDKKQRYYHSKVNLMECKFHLMKELHYYYKLKYPLLYQYPNNTNNVNNSHTTNNNNHNTTSTTSSNNNKNKQINTNIHVIRMLLRQQIINNPIDHKLCNVSLIEYLFNLYYIVFKIDIVVHIIDISDESIIYSFIF